MSGQKLGLANFRKLELWSDEEDEIWCKNANKCRKWASGAWLTQKLFCFGIGLEDVLRRGRLHFCSI